MSIADRYLAYAKAFEESYEDDDWSRLEPYFTESATYDPGLGPDAVAQGRDAIFAYFKTALDGFDRQLSRRLDFDSPVAEGTRTSARFRVSYSKEGAPELTLTGTEIADFEGDRIATLRDEFDPGTAERLVAWMAEQGMAPPG